MALIPLERAPSFSLPFAGFCLVAVLATKWSQHRSGLLHELTELFQETKQSLMLLRNSSLQAMVQGTDGVMQPFPTLQPWMLLLLVLVPVLAYKGTFPVVNLGKSSKKLDREESLGQALVRHLRSIRSHRISFNPSEVEVGQPRNKPRPSLLRRLAGRLRFGGLPGREGSVSSRDSMMSQRSGITRSRFGRWGSRGEPPRSTPSSSTSVGPPFSTSSSTSHVGVLDALLVGLRRPYLGNRRRKLTRPGMARIPSGASLVMADNGCGASSLSEVTGGGNLRILHSSAIIYNGHLAADCLGYEMTHPSFKDDVNKVITEDHLLQLGALMGESSSQLALSQRSAPGPISPNPDSLFGALDPDAANKLADLHKQGDAGWEQFVEEHRPSVHYWAWRHPLRKGLYLYRSRTVYERCSVPQAIAFQFQNHEFRSQWDDSCSEMKVIPPPSHLNMEQQESNNITFGRSAFIYARSKFPPPMAQREYVYARRVWRKADDGGCYIVTRAASHPAPPPSGCRSLMVTDLCSGTVIRSVPGIYSTEPAVEVVTNYYEDSMVSSGIINMAVRKGSWPMVQKGDAGLRMFISKHFDPEAYERMMEVQASYKPKPPTPAAPSPSSTSPATAAAATNSAPLISALPALPVLQVKTAKPASSPSIWATSASIRPLSSRLNAHCSMLDLPAAALTQHPQNRPRHSMADASSPRTPPSPALFTRSASLDPVALSAAQATTPPSPRPALPSWGATANLPSEAAWGEQALESQSSLTALKLADLPGTLVGRGGGSGGGGLGAENSIASFPIEDSEDECSLPVIPASWGNYHPALTTRFHFTPVLYRMYLAAWSNTASLAHMSASLGQTLLRSVGKAHVVLWHSFRKGMAAALQSTSVLAGMLARSVHPQGSADITSHPLKSNKVKFALDATRELLFDTSSDGSTTGHGKPGTAPRKPHWSKRLLVHATSLAVKAIGVPVAHRVLTARASPAGTPSRVGSSSNLVGDMSQRASSQAGRQTYVPAPGTDLYDDLAVQLAKRHFQRHSMQPRERQHHHHPRRVPSSSYASMHKMSRWPILAAESEGGSSCMGADPMQPLRRSASSISSTTARSAEESSSGGSARRRPKRYII